MRIYFILVFLVLSASVFSQELRQSARVVGTGGEVKFWVEGATPEVTLKAEWQIFMVRGDSRVEMLKPTMEEKISYTPDGVGSFIVVAKVGEKTLTSYFESVKFLNMSFERKPSGSGNFAAVKDGAVERNIVAVGDSVRYKLFSTPQLLEGSIRWYEDGKEIGAGDGFEKKIDKSGRFNIQAGISGEGGPSSAPALMTVIGDFKIVSIKNKEGKEISAAPLSVGEEVSYLCEVEPRDFAPQDIGWELTGSDGRNSKLTSGLGGSAMIDVVGTAVLVAKAGTVSTPSRSIYTAGAKFLKPDFMPQHYVVVSKFSNGFDKEGRLKENFIASDPDRFYVEISDMPGNVGEAIEVRTTYENTVLSDWARAGLASEKGRYIAGPFILVSDDVDKVDARAIKAVLGARVEVRYKDNFVGQSVVGARPDDISDNSIRTVDLNVVVLQDPRTGAPVLGANQEQSREIIRNYVRVANERWAQANIRFALKSLAFVDPPANMLVVSGRANGISESGAKGSVHFFINNIEVATATYLNKSAEMTARELISQMPSDFEVKELGSFSVGDEQNFAFFIRSKSNQPFEIRLERALTDTRQHIISGRVDLSDGITVGFFPDELSIEELALTTLNDADSTTVDIIIANELKRQGQTLLGRAYPEELYTDRVANTILLSSALGDGFSYPFFLSKMLGQILLKTTDLISETTNIMWQEDARENKVSLAKRLTSEQVKKVRQLHGYKKPSLLQQK